MFDREEEENKIAEAIASLASGGFDVYLLSKHINGLSKDGDVSVVGVMAVHGRFIDNMQEILDSFDEDIIMDLVSESNPEEAN